MLFCQDLEDIVFNRHEHFECDEMVVLSGYVGPSPVEKLRTLPFPTTVIYGMYGSEGIRRNLHEALVRLDNAIPNIGIKYSTVPVHSKCYVWKLNGNVVHALIGSANFSTNGLTTPFKEVLAETNRDTFAPLNRYLQQVLGRTIGCAEGQISARYQQIVGREEAPLATTEGFCRLVLFDLSSGEVPERSGLNWGMAQITGSHVHIDDAYFPILKESLRNHPDLFPPKQLNLRQEVEEGRIHRHNDAIEIIWDDGVTMRGLLEGDQKEAGVWYPKQIASFPQKKILGQYIRRRIGVPSGRRITVADLDRYGRRNIDISLQGEGIYLFDFSVRR